VNFNLDNSGEWTVLPNGDKIWRLVVSCKGALSINLLYDKFYIPEGAKFWVYSNDRKHSIGAFTSANNNGDRNDIQGFATGLIYGDQVTLEYWLPKEVKEIGMISVAYVVHGYRYILLPDAEYAGYGESGSCQVNVNCSEGLNWQNEKNAVALILVNGYRWCSGSLVNNTADDCRPLFLTASHCLDGYDAVFDNSPNLNHWSFYWNYESPTCTNAVPTIKSTVGAKLVANNTISISDFALLDLTGTNSNPVLRTDITTYYLGWDRSGNAGTGGVGIHHPSGDIKKISTYTSSPTNSTCGVNSNYWDISFVQTANGFSVMQPGSSGSPLINSNKRVIGQLYGPGNCPDIQCQNPSAQKVAYGKFSVSWTGGGESDYRRRLDYWLAPGLGNNAPQTLNGKVVGVPKINISGPTSVSVGSQSKTYYATSLNYSGPAITNYEWSWQSDASNPMYNYGNSVNIYFNVAGSSRLGLRACNTCGYGPWEYLYINAVRSSSAAFYPNPVSDILYIDVSQKTAESARSANSSYDIRLYNGQGTQLRQTATRGETTVQFDVSGLPSGTYFLHIYDGVDSKPEMHQIIVKH